MAQLTRVIHNMNTRNIQNAVLLKDVVKDYEHEIDRITNDCNALLTKAKMIAEKQSRNDDVKDKVKKIEADIESEKRKAKKEFEMLKSKVDDRDKKASGDLEVGNR